jgi:hypothetical protein
MDRCPRLDARVEVRPRLPRLEPVALGVRRAHGVCAVEHDTQCAPLVLREIGRRRLPQAHREHPCRTGVLPHRPCVAPKIDRVRHRSHSVPFETSRTIAFANARASRRTGFRSERGCANSLGKTLFRTDPVSEHAGAPETNGAARTHVQRCFVPQRRASRGPSARRRITRSQPEVQAPAGPLVGSVSRGTPNRRQRCLAGPHPGYERCCDTLQRAKCGSHDRFVGGRAAIASTFSASHGAGGVATRA